MKVIIKCIYYLIYCWLKLVIKINYILDLQIGSTKARLENVESLDTLLSKEILDKSK